MSTHPAEVNEALGQAHIRCLRLIGDAEKREDRAGADAWRVALRSIERAEKAMLDARYAQTWRDPPPTSPMIMPCGGPLGSHPTKQNYLLARREASAMHPRTEPAGSPGSAERCDLGWPKVALGVQHGDPEAHESPEDDQRYSVELAKRLVGRSGSKWHDIEQRLARAVIRTCNELRERDAERTRANEHLTQLHDERKALKELDALFSHANTTRDFLDKLLAGLGSLLPDETPRTVEGLVSAVRHLHDELKLTPGWSRGATIARFARLGTPPEGRCPDCDRPLATRNDFENHPGTCQHCATLCWREYHEDGCVAPRVDWRARAMAAESDQ